MDRGIKNRITTSLHNDRLPIWSSSGKEIVFNSNRSGKLGIYRKAADGGGETVLLHASDLHSFASDWSRDGRHILYDRHGSDIWYLERNNDGGFEAKPFLATEFTEKAAVFSPDSRWVAYVSNESGEFEVYVRRFPEGDRKQRISENGGLQVRWSRDGRRLYYGEEETLFEVEVTPGPELAVGDPQPLFRAPDLRQHGPSAYPNYDVSADGERFVVAVSEGLPVIHVVQNWFAEFRDRQ
ncbi:MAG: hypothetical protein GY953_29115 [bacterium]|nr:hypothetical protein [bacterium]